MTGHRVNVCKPRSQEAEARGCQLGGCPGLCGTFHTSPAPKQNHVSEESKLGKLHEVTCPPCVVNTNFCINLNICATEASTPTLLLVIVPCHQQNTKSVTQRLQSTRTLCWEDCLGTAITVSDTNRGNSHLPVTGSWSGSPRLWDDRAKRT